MRRSVRRGMPLIVAAAVCVASAAEPAAGLEEIRKLLPRDATPGDTFGRSVAIDGDRAIISAPLDSIFGSSSGSANIFRHGGGRQWNEVAKLIPSDGHAGQNFGTSVSISRDTAIVGAFFDEDRGRSAGAAYIFQEDASGQWGQVAKLHGHDTTGIDHFGTSVGISGDTAIVGADLQGQGDTGAAYIFQDDGSGNWEQVAKLTAAGAGFRSHVGESVSISGDTAVVGAPRVSDGANYTGVAYVFRSIAGRGWRQIAKLTASDSRNFGLFGTTVDISGDAVIVGPGDFSTDEYPGAAYIFREDEGGTWTEVTKLTASDADDGDRFSRVGISGDWAVVGAFGP